MTDYELFQAIYGPKSLSLKGRYDLCMKLIDDWEMPVDKLIRVCIDILPEDWYQTFALNAISGRSESAQEIVDKYRVLI